ncbi:LuxR C-terminal-related transcriptional regulator [Actinophytocola sp.]|uniref:LuxR C-terminal-related transcriptional regulator n=1 Tax=Actinophytocola sp. TaxID=1872138 RepID=UPI002ED58091
MPEGVITRRRAEGLLPRSSDKRTDVLGTLVCAPPGYGKTILLSNWADGPRTVAWLDIDEADDDPAVLCAGMLAAVSRTISAQDDHPFPQPRADEHALLTQLVDLVDGQPEQVWLVLDDLHRLRHPDALRSLEELLRRRPRRLRLVISTREYPATGVHRLRVAGLLREIRAADLAFTTDETAELLADQGVSLRDEDMGRLMAITEGWPVAVRLAAAALAESPDHTTTLDHLATTDRAVTEYLSGEVLASLREEQHHLLRSTAVTDRVTPELAAELTQHPDAPSVLGDMERSNLMVFRSLDDEGQYRQHPLLRAYLYATMKDHSPATLAHLHGLASVWYARNGRPATAAHHAVQAGDAEHAARLLLDFGLGLMLRGELTLVSALTALVPAATKARAEVGLVLALVELLTGERAAAELRLTGLAEELAANRDPRVRDLELVVRTQWARLAGRFVPEMDELDRRIPQMSDTDLLVFALLNRGGQLFWLGKHEEASRDLEHVLQLATRHELDYAVLHCLSFQAGIAGTNGDYVEMRRIAEEAIEFAEERSTKPRAASCFAYTVAAGACYQTMEMERASELVVLALDLLDASVDHNIELYTRVLREAIDFEHGSDPLTAMVRLRAIWAGQGRAEPVHPGLVAWGASIEQRMALRLARADWAAEVERRASAWLGDSGDAHLLRARVHAHHGRVTAARSLVERITRGLTPTCSSYTLIEAHILAAVLASRANERQTASVAVRTAIELAAPRGAMRPFYEAGQDVRQLLVGQVGRLGRLNQFVEKLLHLIPVNGPDLTIELTPREAQLLRELPSLATLEEIAASFYLSVNTVKTHLRNLYRKLGVTSRREAITAARQRGLL